MKSISIAIILFVSQLLTGQQAVHNFGNLQLHSEGSLGFHSDLMNDGAFEKNLGLVGFYHEEDNLVISGDISPKFYDFEMAVEKNLFIDVSISIDNSLNFIYGNIISARDKKNVYLKLTENAIYDGEMHLSKIDGHVAVEDQKEFSFPVGYDDILKPLTIKFIDDTFFAKCEYYHESADLPSSYSTGHDFNKKDVTLGSIHSQEFWKLGTTGRVQVSLNWGEECNLSSTTKSYENVIVTAWNKKSGQWDNLGNSKLEGNLNKGLVTSNVFNANDYEVFTLGFLFDIEINKPGNYAMTPNGDGINDYFTLSIIERSPDNELKIFNRSGRLVYEKTNYQNEFHGIANKNTNKTNQQLPKGVYYYIIELKDLNLTYQGYFYLSL